MEADIIAVQILRGKFMKTLTRIGILTSLVAALCVFPSHYAVAQVGGGVSIGEPPVCPYGYYEVPPYNCAPDGYYGPEWFSGGIFLGAGPWYHGSGPFYAPVDHHLDYRKGYHGPVPARGERPAEHRAEFHGNAM